jgi:hypothetical protein
MNTVPAMISTKDLLYLEDMLNWSLSLCKKARSFSAEVTDENLKETFINLSDSCLEHYNMFLSALNIGGQNE